MDIINRGGNESRSMELVELEPQGRVENNAENNADILSDCNCDTIINVDSGVWCTGQFQNGGFGFSFINGDKGQILFRCVSVIACCPIVRNVVSHFDLTKAEMDISTLISFAYDISLLADRVRFFLLLVNFGDIQPSMKFICSRMAATIDDHDTVEMESRLGYILLAVAALIGILETATNMPCLDLPLGKLLLELAGIFLECLSSILQVMTFEMTVIIFAKKVQKMWSNEFELISCQASTSPKEILKLIMTGVRALVVIHYWALRGYDLFPAILNWWSSF